jgi:DNA repair photolyase
MIDGKPIKGRGAGGQVRNRFAERHYAAMHWEAIDEPIDEQGQTTKYIETHARTIVNRVDSPDLPFRWSLNPYQGCEHGCSYCYARPTHEYWGYGAGLDFERVVMVKRNAPELLEKTLRGPRWQVDPIVLSGATDPYQPIERKERLTRALLEVLWRYKHPAGLITKNALVLRDIDLLRDMAAERLVCVAISLTTLNEDLRRRLEPRTSSGLNRLKAIEALRNAGVPVFVMIAPIIPALNEPEVPLLLRSAADAGALSAGYTVLRTNGAVGEVFEGWLHTHYPDRASKIMAQTKELHGGRMGDSEAGRRMRGEGVFATNIARLFNLMKRRYFEGRSVPELDRTAFSPPPQGQLDLFGPAAR